MVGGTGVAYAGDATNYFYGADGNGPIAQGSRVFYTEPNTGGVFGGYVAEVGTWTNMTGCTSGRAINWTNVNDANSNSWYKYGTQYPTGTALYFYMAGPGADPKYSVSSPSGNEAYAWGARQASYALQQWKSIGPAIRDYVMIMDIENPGNGTYNGWDEQVNSCGTYKSGHPVPYTVDRAAFNGFFDTISHSGTGLAPAVYSRQDYWNFTFGTGSAGYIPNTREFTAQSHSNYALPAAYGWCQPHYSCAAWFGHSHYGLAWQYAIANNGGADYDQFYAPNAK